MKNFLIFVNIALFSLCEAALGQKDANASITVEGEMDQGNFCH